MKKIIIVSMFIVLVIGCDISSVFENMPDIVFPPEKESTEYILQSGNPLFYFGFGVEELEFSDNTIRTGDFEYIVENGSVMLPMGNMEVVVSVRMLTFISPDVDPLVFVSL